MSRDLRAQVIQEMIDEVKAVNGNNGWFDTQVTVGDLCALLHSEVSEAFEAWRKYGYEDQTVISQDVNIVPKPEGYGSELADVLIRLLDQCDRDGVDLVKEFERKLEYNKTRGYRHGGKRV